MRRGWILSIVGGTSVALAVLVGARVASPGPAQAAEVTVYTTPNCGCCTKWAGQLEQAGFDVNVQRVEDLTPIKARYGVGQPLQACHTAVVGGYVVEGHVPADVIQRLLNERPAVTGIAVPGMPIGSPGMEQGGQQETYDVLSFDRSGITKVYARR